jgi:hypothetical protein
MNGEYLMRDAHNPECRKIKSDMRSAHRGYAQRASIGVNLMRDAHKESTTDARRALVRHEKTLWVMRDAHTLKRLPARCGVASALWRSYLLSRVCVEGRVSVVILSQLHSHQNPHLECVFRVDRRRALSAPDARVVRHVHCHAHVRAMPGFWVSPPSRLSACSLSAHRGSRESLSRGYEGACEPLPATVLKPFPNRSATVRCCRRIPTNSGISRELSRNARGRVRVLSGIPSGSRWDCSGITHAQVAHTQGSSDSNRSTFGAVVTPRHTASRQETPRNAIASALSLGRPWVVLRDSTGTRASSHVASTLLAQCSHQARTGPHAGVPESELLNSGDNDSPKATVFRPLRAQQQPPNNAGVVRSGWLRPLRPAVGEASAQP